eukprot:m.446241 g.446241  ORF g.446241 m.446241 type:complete len:315 (-) comp20309_c0_seq1:1522-2466(-)
MAACYCRKCLRTGRPVTLPDAPKLAVDFKYDYQLPGEGLCGNGGSHGRLTEAFVPLDRDAATARFLATCDRKTDNVLCIMWHSCAQSLLSPLLSVTSINAILARGGMFVLSTDHLRRLLSHGASIRNDGPDWRRVLGASGTTLLDIGAGDGGVTAHLAELVQHVVTTEVDAVMRWRLRQRGYRSLSPETWQASCSQDSYELIAIMNVLDRCDKPLTLLRDLINCLSPNGFMVIAVVLPFRPFVEEGAKRKAPSEALPLCGESFQAQACSMITDVFGPLGLVLHAWSRVPYLCEGDLIRPVYSLDDALFVLTKAG